MQAQQAGDLKAHQSRPLRLDRRPHRLQPHEQSLPQIGDPGGIGRDYIAKVRALLTKEQTRRWKGLTGKPFKGPARAHPGPPHGPFGPRR